MPRCLLAVKHASAAMKQTNPSRGKEYSGGSIILTASGKPGPLRALIGVLLMGYKSCRVALRSWFD